VEDTPDVPPDGGGGTGGIPEDPPPNIFENVLGYLPEGYGTDSNGDANTGFRIVLTGYKGGIANTNGDANPIANVASGSQTFDFPSSALEQKDLAITPGSDLMDAELVIAEIQNEAGTVKGNSVIYTRTHTDTGLIPSPPTITTTPTFNFSAKTASVTISNFGWDAENATIHCQSIYSGIENPAATQTASDTFADLAGSTTLTANFPFDASTPATIADLVFAFSTVPAVVAIWASNTYGRSDVFLIEDSAKTPGVVKTGPTLTAFALASQTVTDDSVQFTIDPLGGQVGGFTVHYAALPANGDAAITGTVAASATTAQQTFKVSAGATNVNGWYYIYIAGEQGNSNTMFVSNVTPA
jgi:hypothetical protein